MLLQSSLTSPRCWRSPSSNPSIYFMGRISLKSSEANWMLFSNDMAHYPGQGHESDQLAAFTATDPSAQTVKSSVFILVIVSPNFFLLSFFLLQVVTILGAWSFFSFFLFIFIFICWRKVIIIIKNTAGLVQKRKELIQFLLCVKLVATTLRIIKKRGGRNNEIFFFFFFFLVSSVLTGSTVATSMLVELSFSSITSFSTFKDSTVASFRDMD